MKKLPLFTGILVLNSLIFASCSTAGGNTAASIPSSTNTDINTPAATVQTTTNTVTTPVVTKQPTQTVQRKYNTRTKAS